jgi:hypothetical protein
LASCIFLNWPILFAPPTRMSDQTQRT